MDIFSNLETYVFFTDENNTKPLVISSKHVFLIRKQFCTLIFASKNI